MRKRFRQNFDGHVAPELGVVRLIHFSHAARANRREDFVGAEMCASGERHFFNPAGQFRHDGDRRLTPLAPGVC